MKLVCILAIAIVAASAGGSAVFEHRNDQQPHGQEFRSAYSQSQQKISTKSAKLVAQSSTPVMQNQTDTPTATPTPTPQPETTNQTETETPTRTSEKLLLNGSISNPSPPGNTAIETTIRLRFADVISNGTIIRFNDTYTSSDIRLKSVQSPTTNGTKAITGQVRQSRTDNGSHPQILFTTTKETKTVAIVATIRHPDVQNDSTYQLTAHPPESHADTKRAIVSYRVRSIGDDRRSGRTEEFDRVDGEGFVYSNATVYQGEADLEFRGALDPPLRGVSGDTEGHIFEPPVPVNIPTGTYSSDGTNTTAAIRVQTPKMETLRVENTNGVEISAGAVYPETTDTLTVTAQSNFEDAEEIELTVQNDDGIDITREVIETARVRPETPDGSPPIQTMSSTATNQGQMNAGYDSTLDDRINFIKSESSLTESKPTRSLWSHNDQVFPQTTGSVTPERRVNQTDVEPGTAVEITLTGVVDSAGRISFDETFSPTVAGAEVNSVTSSTGPVSPIIAAATEKGLSVVLAGASPGSTITVTYTIQTGESDATYRLDGSVETRSEKTEYSDTTIIVGSGGNTELTSDGKVSWKLDVTEIETDSLFISVSGADDLTDQEATASTDVAIRYNTVSLSPKTIRPARGQNLELSIKNGSYGSTHTLIISDDDLRSTLARDEYNNVFRNVGTTRTIGFITQSGERVTGATTPGTDPVAVFAEVRVDPDNGVGTAQVRTRALADEATIELSDTNDLDSSTIGRSADSVDISIIDNSAKLTAPNTYTTRSETTIRGDITSGIDSVVMYVREGSQFKQVDLDGKRDGDVAGISVSGDSFSRELTLSDGDGPGNTLLSVPGTYQVALRSQSSLSERYNGVPATLSVPEILSKNTSIQTLTVQNTSITLDKPGLDGSIAATASTVTVEGTVDGRESALIVATGDRGSIETVQVDGPNFSDVAIPINNFANGIVTVHAISTGRDGEIGDGEFDENRITTLTSSPLDEFAQYLTSVADAGATGKQVRTVLRSESDLDVASDDPVVMRELLVTDPTITINSPAGNQPLTGNTTQVRGTTNIPSGNTRIEVALRKRGTVTTDAYVRKWNEASWNTTVSIPDNASGTYTLTAETEESARSGRRIILRTARGSSRVTSTTMVSTASQNNVENQTQVATVPSDVTATSTKTPDIEINATETVDSTVTNPIESQTPRSTATATATATATVSTPLKLPGFAGLTLIFVLLCTSVWFWVRLR